MCTSFVLCNYFDLLLNKSAISKPITMDSVIPAEVADNPPVKIPMAPFSLTAFWIPLAME